MLEGVSAVYRAGANVDWRGCETGSGRIVDLPYYPFQRHRYWFRARPQASSRPAGSQTPSHPLLGSRLRSAVRGAIYEATISADASGFVRQHRVLDHVILPAAAYLEMLIAGACDVLRADAVRIEDVTISEAMLLADDGAARTVQTVFEADHEGSAAVAISSVAATPADSTSWQRHVTARATVGRQPPATSASLSDLRAQCPWPVALPEFYDTFKQRGVQFGDDFHTVRRVWRGEAQAVGEVALTSASEASSSGYRLHPLLLDGCLQLLAAALPADDPPTLYLPVAVGSYTVFGVPAPSAGVTSRFSRSQAIFLAPTCVCSGADGRRIAELLQIELKRATRVALGRIGERWLDDCLYQTEWRPAEAEPENPNSQHRFSAGRSETRDWLVFADSTGVAAGLAARIKARGESCSRVSPGSFMHGPEEHKIDPTSAEDYRRLLRELRAAGHTIDGVIHAWSLDSGAWDGMSDAELTEAETRSAISPLLLAQALVAEPRPPRLWIVTRGAQQTDGERSLSPVQAAAWGLSRSIALEHPELNCTCVDLDPGPHSGEVDALLVELASRGMECTGRSTRGWAPRAASCPTPARH